MTRLTKHRLFWPAACLLALVVLNTAVRPRFIKVTLRDGELYGAPIDILRQSAPLMLVALGDKPARRTRIVTAPASAQVKASAPTAPKPVSAPSRPHSVRADRVASSTESALWTPHCGQHPHQISVRMRGWITPHSHRLWSMRVRPRSPRQWSRRSSPHTRRERR